MPVVFKASVTLETEQAIESSSFEGDNFLDWGYFSTVLIRTRPARVLAFENFQAEADPAKVLLATCTLHMFAASIMLDHSAAIGTSSVLRCLVCV